MVTPANTPARVQINPQVAQAAREQANLDVEEAASRLNKLLKRDRVEPASPSDLLAWESGASRPTEVQADLLARVYLVPFVQLFQDKPPSPGITDFRLGSTAKTAPLSYDTLEELARFSRLYAVAKRVSVATGTVEDVSIPRRARGTISDVQEMDLLGEQLRSALGITNEVQESWRNDQQALSTWRERIEGMGAFVFRLPMSPDECRGASRWELGGPPAILLNSIDAVSAQLFSLLHEFAHFVLESTRSTAVCDPPRFIGQGEERLANRFAGAALVPRDLLTDHLPARSPDHDYALWPADVRNQLRSVLRVSHAVIGIRLQQLGIVTDSGYQRFMRSRSGPVRGKSRPVWERYRRYVGGRATKLLRAAIESEAITATEIAILLDIKVRDVESLAG